MVVDGTGDLDVGAAAGADYTDGQFIVTTVFRLCDVDQMYLLLGDGHMLNSARNDEQFAS